MDGAGQQTDPIRECLRERSRWIKDPAGRDIQVFEDQQFLDLATECKTDVGSLYREALELGIYPLRYIRNREAISASEQLVLAKSRVGVVGAGGLGGTLILLLARVGVGSLVVVDRDAFEESNLNRQALCNVTALGEAKAREAARVVAGVNPGVRVLSHDIALNRENGPLVLEGSQIIVDALDNVPDRLVLEEVASELNVPLVHGALAGFEGQLMTVFPGDFGLRKLYGEGKGSGESTARPEAVLGVPPFMPSLIATFQAMEVVKLLLGRGRSMRHTLLHADLEAGRLDEFAFGTPE